MGLLFFSVHFWTVYFLLLLTQGNTPLNQIVHVAVLILDFPVALISLFGIVHVALWNQGQWWAESYVILSGSLFYFGLGYLVGLDRDQKRLQKKLDIWGNVIDENHKSTV